MGPIAPNALLGFHILWQHDTRYYCTLNHEAIILPADYPSNFKIFHNMSLYTLLTYVLSTPVLHLLLWPLSFSFSVRGRTAGVNRTLTETPQSFHQHRNTTKLLSCEGSQQRQSYRLVNNEADLALSATLTRHSSSNPRHHNPQNRTTAVRICTTATTPKQHCGGACVRRMTSTSWYRLSSIPRCMQTTWLFFGAAHL